MQRGTALQAFALLLFGLSVAVAMLVIVAQSIARLTHTGADDFPVLRALGSSRPQLFAVALAPGALVAVAGMALAIPLAYGLSVFTPIGLARQAEITPGFSFDPLILLGGAAVLALLLAGRAALSALRAAQVQAGLPVSPGGRGSRAARWLARRGFPPTAVSGVRLAFEPGRDRSAVPVRSAILGMVLALAAVHGRAGVRVQPGPRHRRSGGRGLELGRGRGEPALRGHQRADRAQAPREPAGHRAHRDRTGRRAGGPARRPGRGAPAGAGAGGRRRCWLAVSRGRPARSR